MLRKTVFSLLTIGAVGLAAAATRAEPVPAFAQDWNGAWEMSRVGARLMFDPAHAYIEPDPAGSNGGVDFGPTGGSHLVGIPYKPDYQKQYADIVAKAKAGNASDPVGVGCRPYGMPRVMSATPRGPEFILTPDLIVIILGDETRQVYMDGRSHPTTGVDAVHNWEGHSIGHWDKQTLVIDTVNVYAGNYDQSNAPHSDKIHILERIRQVDANTLENQITVEDPVMFTRPWTVVKQYKRARQRFPDVLASNCGPNEHTEFINGAQHIKLPFE